jgi:predicted membrane-bound mannosyltransferase/DNA-binding beta-propeller fold protein YncE
MESTQEQRETWLDRPILTHLTLSWEVVIFASIVVLFIASRFYMLENRVMSHDESLHTYYSWLLSEGRGYTHTPMMHGPLQFHLIALSYFLFGDNDFSSRIPAVLASIFGLIFLWNYRRYLGTIGTLIAAGMVLISPYLLYYSRYVRNESFVVVIGLVTLWSILRYLETGKDRYLYYLTTATVLHFIVKETAYIYTAQALLFLGLYFVNRITRLPWQTDRYRKYFLIAMIVTLVLAGAGIGSYLFIRESGGLSATETLTPSVPEADAEFTPPAIPSPISTSLIIFAGIASLATIFFLVRGYSWKKLRKERSFSMLLVLTTLTLPMLAPFPERIIGWNPLDYSQAGMVRTGAFLVPLFILSAVIGLVWNPRFWVINGAIFYSIYVVFYTTIFTNGGGFFTGIVGSLGYWLEQQGVRRGSQPFYYYYLIQIPFYEYLAALGSFLALILGVRYWWHGRKKPAEEVDALSAEPEAEGLDEENQNKPAPALILIGFWAVTSLVAYSIAGEKMPWLTVHIAWPMILLSGWALGQLVETTNWADLRQKRIFLVLAVMIIFITSLTMTLISLFGTNRPFAGRELDQLQATSAFVFSSLTAIVSGGGLYFLLKPWSLGQVGRVATLTVFSLLAVLTVRTAFNANYINYDEGTEYLVYAHGARGVKEVMEQVEEISMRTTDGLALQVAYDDDISWPFTWYLRNYTNARYYGKDPTRDLRDLPVILVGDNNYAAVEPIVGQAFHEFDYIRMVWPDQDYFNLTPERLLGALTDPAMRKALFNVWLNRDYSEYATLKGRTDLIESNWNPSDRMRMYVRRDLASRLWNYGVGPAPEEVIADPYEGKQIELAADSVVGSLGLEPGQFDRPRGVAVAPDGSLYVADSGNHRIQHLSVDGEVIETWGVFGATTESGIAPQGSFNEPWGVEVGPDGSVYVADTWNHRIQKFSADGEFLTSWGFFGQAEDGYALWGPRDIAVDNQGRVLVADTGNKRIVAFDQDGGYLSEVGFSGFELGEFNEPTGIAVDEAGFVYVADAWNQRIQVLTLGEDNSLTPVTAWDIVAWYGQSLDNKPYLDVNSDGRLLVSDPEGARILEFTSEGEFIRYWGSSSTLQESLNLPTGVDVDPAGGLWVSDAGNHTVLHYSPPE